MSVKEAKETFEHIFKELELVVVGQRDLLDQMMIAILCGGNALLESVPGLAKTLSVKTMASITDLSFSRIQSTPDLMPSDITGTFVLEEAHGKREFVFQKGPLFANIILVDEINRATPKTQSALLEAMQEKQVTVLNKTFALEQPFFVLATQNPIEQEGTFPLPEAQQDRFLMKIKLDYPSFDEEVAIVDRFTEKGNLKSIRPIMKKDHLEKLQDLAMQMPVSNELKKYAVALVVKTRKMPDVIEVGASPRASLGLVQTAKARALMHGRNFVSKEDINTMALPVLRHRLLLSFEAQRKNLTPDDIIKELAK